MLMQGMPWMGILAHALISCLQAGHERLADTTLLSEDFTSAAQAVTEGLALSRHISAASQTASAQIAALRRSLALHSGAMGEAAAAAAVSSNAAGHGIASAAPMEGSEAAASAPAGGGLSAFLSGT